MSIKKPAIEAVSTRTELTIKELRKVLKLAFSTRRNLFIMSDPGLGKTEEIGVFAKSLSPDALCHTYVASMLDRLDMAGLPYRTDRGTTEFALMSQIADATQELNPHGPPTVLYFNELNSAPDSVQPVLLRLLNERAISGYKLRDNVMMIADGNYPINGGRLAKEVPDPTKRRFLWIHIRADKDAWLEYSSLHGCDARVTAYIQRHSADGVLCDYREGGRGRTTYACPASWSLLGRELPFILRELQSDQQLSWIKGTIGDAMGELFMGFLAHQDSIPDIPTFLDAVRNDRKSVVIPEDIDARYMLLGMAANHIIEKGDDDNLTAGLILVQLLLGEKNGEKHGEEAIFFFRSLAKRKGMKSRVIKIPECKKVFAEFKKDKSLWAAIIQSSLDSDEINDD